MAGRVILLGALALTVLTAHVNALVVPIMARRQMSQPRLLLSETLRPQRTILLNRPAFQRSVSPFLQTLLRPNVQRFVAPVRQNTVRPSTIVLSSKSPPGSTATSTSKSGVFVVANPKGCGSLDCGVPQNGDKIYYSDDLRLPVTQQMSTFPASTVVTPMNKNGPPPTGPTATSSSTTSGVTVTIGNPKGCGSYGCYDVRSANGDDLRLPATQQMSTFPLSTVITPMNKRGPPPTGPTATSSSTTSGVTVTIGNPKGCGSYGCYDVRSANGDDLRLPATQQMSTFPLSTVSTPMNKRGPPNGGPTATSSSTSSVIVKIGSQKGCGPHGCHNGWGDNGGRKYYVEEVYDQIVPAMSSPTVVPQDENIPEIANNEDSTLLLAPNTEQTSRLQRIQNNAARLILHTIMF